MTASFHSPAADLARTVYSIYTLVQATVSLCVRFNSLILAQFSVNCLNSCHFWIRFDPLEHMLGGSKREKREQHNVVYVEDTKVCPQEQQLFKAGHLSLIPLHLMC